MSKGSKKFYANKHVLMTNMGKAPLGSKRKLFRSIVGGSVLWYCSAVSPNALAMSSINTLQLTLDSAQ